MVETAHIDVAILCGGMGTRLGTTVADRPKPMVEIGRRPFLEILMDHVAQFGFRRFVLCIGYKADIIKQHFLGEKDRTIVFSEEPTPLGTAGALKHCEPLVESRVFLVMNGDSLCPLNLVSLLGFHEQHGGIGSIAAVPVDDRTDGGFIEVGENHRIVAFSEKLPSSRQGYLNAGIYVLNREVFKSIPQGQPYSLEQEVLPSIVRDGLYAYLTTEMLYDIGTPERLEIYKQAWLH